MILEPLSYLIGADDDASMLGECLDRLFELSYDAVRGDIAYGNLRDEKGRFHNLAVANKRGRFAPYLPGDDITATYGEFCPDPRGDGYLRNIGEQVARKKAAGFIHIELDNPDTLGLRLDDVLAAHSLAFGKGLSTVAKNPVLVQDSERYLAHESIDLVICEHDSQQGSDAMDALRRAVNKPLLAVRFVAFVDEDEDGAAWATHVADNIRKKGYRNMGVTLSRRGEYTMVEDLVLPME